MFKQKLKTLNSVKRVSLLAMLVIVLVASFVAAFSRPDKAEAATNSTINFQARLLTAAGKVVPDGTYNVEFKLYDVASSGTALWTETRTSTDRVRTVNGYLTVNLGSITGFGTNINWDQELWLTMNIGGTAGSPSWDGEMSPRLKLTSVPYAFRAGQLVGGTGANTTTLDAGTPSGNNLIHLPAESGTLCVQNSTNCGFATSAGSGNYIQNGTSLQTANFYIQSAASNSVGGIIRGAASQTSSLFQLLDGSSGLTVAQFTNNGYLHLGSDSISRTGQVVFHDGTLSNTFVATLIAPTALTANRTITLPNETGTLCIQSSTSCGFAAGSGDADYIQNQNASAQTTSSFYISGVGRSDTALEAPILRTNNGTTNRHVIDGSTSGNVTFNANGASTDFSIQGDTDTSLFVADGSSDRIGIGVATPGYKLDVNGDINVSSGSVYRINGQPICTVSGCVSAPASGSYIQNGTTVQTNANFNIRSNAIGSVTGVVQGANGQTADIFQAQTWNGTTATTVLAVAANGTVTAGAGLAATGTVNINASSNNNTNINTGTSTGTVTIGGGSSPLAIDSTNFDVSTAGAVSGVTTLTTSGAINGQTISSAANFTGTLAVQGNTTIGDSVANDTLTLNATLQGSTPLVFEGTTADGNETTFAITDPTTDRTVTFGDEGGTVCLQNSVNCGFALSSGSGNYIQNGTTIQTANYAIRSAAIGSVAAVVQGANGQTADLLRVQTWNGTTATSVVTVDNTGLLTAGAGVSATGGVTATGTISLNASSNNNTNINTGTSTGTVTIGGGSAPLAIDSTNFDVSTAGAVSGVTTLTTSGAINGQTISSTANFTGTVTIQGSTALTLGTSSSATGSIVLRGSGGAGTLTVAGPTTPNVGNFTVTIPAVTANANFCTDNTVCTGYAPASGSGNYIQNGTAVQTANFAIRSSAIGNVGAVIQGANGQTADILRVQTWNGTTATTVFGVGNTGNITATGTYNSNTFNSSTLTFGAAGTATISSAAGQALNVTSNAAATWSTSTGNLSIQAQGNLNLGNAGGQNINIGTDNKAHTITIGNQSTTGAQSIIIGSNGNTGNSVSLESGATGTLNIGASASAHSINIGNGAAVQTIAIGSTNGTSSLSLSSGTGDLNLTSTDLLIAKATTSFQVQNSSNAALLYVDTANGRVGVGGQSTFSKFEVIGGDAAVYNSGNNPRLVLGDSTSAGQNGYLQWDSTNDYFRIESVGTNGLKINDNFIAIGNMFPDQPLKVANGSTLLHQISTTGTSYFKTSTNNAVAFQIQDSSNNGVFTVDTSASEIEFGKASTTSGKLVFYNSSNANVVNIQSGVTSSAYTLTLPTALGNAGDCLKDAGSGALQFTACGNLSGSLQGAYTSSIGGTTPEIIVDSSRGGVDIQDVSTPGSSLGTNPLFAVRGQATASTLGAKYFSIQGDGRVAIGNITATNALDVAGSINVTTGNTYKINGTDICSAAGCTAASGSGFYIQNGTAQQTANFNIVSNAAGSTAAQIQNAASSTVPVLIVKGGATPGTNADLIQLQDSSAAVHLKVDNDGDAAISKSLKVGTTASMASSTLDVAGNAAFTVNNTSTNTQTVLIEQTGTGDSAIELKNTSLSYYMGIDTSAGTFKLSSSQASGSTVNMGYTAVGGTTDSADRNTMNATKFTASATGTVSALNVYVASPISGNPNDKGQVAIYSDNAGVPNSRLGFSNDATLAGNTWNTISLTSGVSVTSGTVYWLVYNTNGSTNSNNNLVYDSGAANQTRWVAQTYGTWPTTWSGGSFSSVQFSMYAPIAVSGASDNLGAGLMEISGTGATKFKNSTNSTAAFQIQNAGGTAFFNADSTNQRIGIGTSTPSYKLDVVGDVNISTGSAYKINGTNICVAAGCTAASGSGFYIQNGTAQQTANFNIISGSSGSTAAQIQGAANGTQTILVVKGSSTPGANADLIQLQDSASNVLMKVDNDGDMTVARSINVAYVNGVDSFQIQGASNPFVTVNPSTNKFYIGDASSACGGRFCVNQPVTGTGGSTYTNMFSNMPVAVTTASNFIGQDITITDTSGNAVANTTRGIRIDMSGSTAQGASYNGLLIRTPTTTSNSVFAGNIIQLQNGSTNLMRVTNTGNVDFQNTLNSTNAFTVFNSSSTAVLNVDTTNSRVGIGTGTGAPNEKLQVAGGINLGNTVLNNAGSIRWSGSDFEGYNGTTWVSMTNNVLTTTPVVSKRKAVNETVNNSSTFQADDELFFNIGANETWSFRVVIHAISGTTPDFKMRVTAPSGATCVYGIADTEAAVSNGNNACSASSGVIAGSGADEIYFMYGTVANGATPGSVNVEWAQNTTTATDTTVYAGSSIDASRSVGGSGTAQAFIQGGNSFGATAVLGTNDGQALQVRTNGTTRMTISSAGNTTLSNGTTGVSLQVNHNNSTSNILNLNNNSSNIFTVNANGDLMIDGIADSATAFQIVDGSGTTMLNFNTNDGAMKINGNGTNGGNGRLYFGDQTWVYIGEYTNTDSDAMQLIGENGIYFGGGAAVDTLNLIDTMLTMNGDGTFTGTVAIGGNAATEALSVTGNFNVRNSGTLTKQYRFRTTGSALDFEGAGADMYFSVWSGSGFTGTQYQHIILDSASQTMWFPNLASTTSSTYRVVCINPSGDDVKMGATNTTCQSSSARYKQDIQTMAADMGIETIMALRPVTYHYKDGNPRQQVGFIAEEMNSVLPELVVYDDQGRPDAINYEYLVANLTKGIQQQQSQINQIRVDMNELRQGIWNGGLVTNDTTFNNLVTFNSGVKFTSDATFEGNVAFKKKVTYSEDAAGTITIPKGETEFEVKFKAPYASVPRIALSADQFVTLKVTDKTVDGFKINLRVPYTEDVIVDWVATQTEIVASNP